MGGKIVREGVLGMSLMLATVIQPNIGEQAMAQQVATSASTVMSSEAMTGARRVSVSLENIPLPDAIQSVANQSHLIPVYDATQLSAKRAVTVHVHKVRVDSAFRAVLAGSGLRAVIRPGGTVVIVKDSTGVSQDGVIRGIVVHAKTKMPIEGATVTLVSGRRVYTDATGAFQLAVAPGDQTIAVRAIGMAQQTKSIVVRAGSAVELAFSLEPGTNVLSEVVVTGTVVATERKAIATPITVIKAEELERRNITRIEQLFHGEVPGIFAVDKGMQAYSGGNVAMGENLLGNMVSSDIYARGSSKINVVGEPTPIKTYVDGVEILDPSYLGTLDPQSFERIEIITGPQAATIYGSGAMGGVMQIFTKKGTGARTPEVTVHSRFGVLQSNLSSALTPAHDHGISVAGGSGAGFSYSGTITYRYSGAWQPFLFNQKYGGSIGMVYSAGPLTAQGSFSATGIRNGTISGDLRSASPVTQELQSTGVWRQWLGYMLPPSQRVSTSRSQTASLALTYRPYPSWQHTLTLGKSQTALGVVPERPRYLMASDSLYGSAASSGERVTFNYSSTASLPVYGVFAANLTVGLNGSFGEQMRVDGCLATLTSTAYLACTTTSPMGASKSPKMDSKGAFASGQLGVFDRLYLTLGIRAERNPNYGEAHKIDWTPTNGVAYNFEFGEVTLKILGSYGRATRAPEPEMRLEEYSDLVNIEPSRFLSQFANPDLRPEYSRGPQGGVEVYFGNLGSLTINRYRQRVTDLIQRIYVDSAITKRISSGQIRWRQQAQYVNIAEIASHGWELTGSVNLMSLSLKGTYTWNDSRIKRLSADATSLTTYYEGGSFRGIPTHTGHIQATFARGGSSVTLASNWTGKAGYGRGEDLASYNRQYGRLPMYNPRRGGAGWWRPAYLKSDLSVLHRLTPWISATIHVTNLGNSFQADQNMFYASLGRQSQMGLSVKLPRQ